MDPLCWIKVAVVVARNRWHVEGAWEGVFLPHRALLRNGILLLGSESAAPL